MHQFSGGKLLKKCGIAALFSVFMMLLSVSARAQDVKKSTKATLSDCPVKYVTDGLEATDGSIWVIGERSGIYRYWKGKDIQSSEWMCADYYSGYPQTENFYGLAEDKQGRIWVGTDHQGVFVFNGVSWKQYNRENGLIGERIFDINVSPLTGEVAIATSMGIEIYNPKDESWKTFTRGNGLYADQVSSVSYDAQGNLWLAYECGGVGKASPRDQYTQWELVQAPWYRDTNQYVRQPLEAMGVGLPSNLANTILAGSGKYVWVGTNDGIGFTSNGKGWKFARGEDYWLKNKGAYQSELEGNAPPVGRKLLPEDYVTAMLLAPKGLWIGFREKGAALVRPGSLEIIEQAVFPKELGEPWVTGFVSTDEGEVYALTYGNGVIKIQEGNKKGSHKRLAKKSSGEVKHPEEKPVSDLASLKKRAEDIQKLEDKGVKKNPAVFWKEDWATQGDWCQRYGAEYTILCGANFQGMSQGFSLGFKNSVGIGCRLGCNLGGKKGGVRSVLGWLNKAEDGNVLFNPERCLRTQGTWMDATIGEGVDGSDLWLVIKVEKKTKYNLSLYFYNAGVGEYPILAKRDNLIEIRKFKSTYPDETSLNLFASQEKDKEGKDPLEEETALIQKEPVLARARVKDTSGNGVYKTFVLDGPGVYYVRLARNGSQGVRLNGIFVSSIDSKSLFRKTDECELFQQYGGIVLSPTLDSKDLSQMEQDLASSWDRANEKISEEELSLAQEWSLEAYRHIKKTRSDSLLVPSMRWKLNLWHENEKNAFEESLLKSWYVFQESRKGPYITEEYFEESPRVLPVSVRDAEIMEYLKIDWKEYVAEEGKPYLPWGDLRKRLDKVTDEELEAWKERRCREVYERMKKQMKEELETKEKC